MPDTQTTDLPVTLSDIEAAASLLEGQIVHTPLNLSRTLSHITGAEVWVKFENQQFTAAFKERGALNKLSKLTDDQKQRGVIAASAGNHSQGVAYHARRLGLPATIVMAKTTPFSKVEHTRSHGARVLLEGLIFDEAKQYAMEVCERDNLTFLHPFDDPDIIAGQGTIALEMLAAQPDLDTLVVPIGGGGLISGIAIAAKALKPDIQIIGVQPEIGLPIEGKPPLSLEPHAAQSGAPQPEVPEREPVRIPRNRSGSTEIPALLRKAEDQLVEVQSAYVALLFESEAAQVALFPRSHEEHVRVSARPAIVEARRDRIELPLEDAYRARIELNGHLALRRE